MINDISLENSTPSYYSQEAAHPAQSPLLAAILQELQLTTATMLQHIPNGIKTQPMLEELDEGALVNYNPSDETLSHQGISFQVQKGSTADFSQKKIVCIGSSPLGREIISLDPENSPLLEEKYQKLLTYLHSEEPLASTLDTIANYIREEVFSPPVSTEKKLEQFIQRWQRSSERTLEDFTVSKEESLIPVIPLDDFIQARSGVCRHQALVSAYFLDRLQQETDLLPKGKVYHVRDVVAVGSQEGGHAWNLYVPDDGSQVWHFDALWHVVKDCKDPDDLQFLYASYGKKAIAREMRRFLLKKAPESI
jgi:hypothetical protein